jgi:hypothetical protein
MGTNFERDFDDVLLKLNELKSQIYPMGYKSKTLITFRRRDRPQPVVVFSRDASITTTSWGGGIEKINIVAFLNNDDQLINTVVFPVNTRTEGPGAGNGERESAAARGVVSPDVANAVCME